MRMTKEIREQVEELDNYWVLMTLMLELLLDIRELLLEKRSEKTS